MIPFTDDDLKRLKEREAEREAFEEGAKAKWDDCYHAGYQAAKEQAAGIAGEVGGHDGECVYSDCHIAMEKAIRAMEPEVNLMIAPARKWTYQAHVIVALLARLEAAELCIHSLCVDEADLEAWRKACGAGK